MNFCRSHKINCINCHLVIFVRISCHFLFIEIYIRWVVIQVFIICLSSFSSIVLWTIWIPWVILRYIHITGELLCFCARFASFEFKLSLFKIVRPIILFKGDIFCVDILSLGRIIEWDISWVVFFIRHWFLIGLHLQLTWLVYHVEITHSAFFSSYQILPS